MSAPPWTPSVYLLTDLTGCWHAQRKWKLWDKTDKVNIFSHTISHVTTKMGNIKWATSSLKICPGSTKNTERMPLKGNPSPGEPRQLLNRLRGRQRPQRAPDNSEGPSARAAAWGHTDTSGAPPAGSPCRRSSRGRGSPRHPEAAVFDSLDDTAQAQGRWEPQG